MRKTRSDTQRLTRAFANALAFPYWLGCSLQCKIRVVQASKSRTAVSPYSLLTAYPRFPDATAVAALRITSSTALGWESIET
jgi:hypothetical protein